MLHALVSTAGACSAEDGLPELDYYETERARIAAQRDFYPLCAGDLSGVDAQVGYVEDVFSFAPREPLQIFWVSWEYHRCSPETNACYTRDDEIFTIWQSLNHEVVHAVTRNVDFPSLFWSECTAEVLSNKVTFYDERTVLRGEDLQANTLTTYITASHFCRFLVETYGMEAFVRAVQGESLRDVFGAGADELAALYERDVPFSYPPLRPCPYPEVPEVGPGQWREELEFGCDSPSATQFDYGTFTGDNGAAMFRTVSLPAGTYAFELQGGLQLLVEGCMTQSIDEEPPKRANGDVHNQSERWGLIPFEANVEHVLTLTEGTYRVAVASGTLEPARLDLRIERLD